MSQQRRLIDPLRKASAGQAYGVVVEVGAGNGLNFSWYDPQRVERVEAVEPDSAMLSYARERAGQAAVPITLTQASVETLPWADATFDSAVATLVFCSVADPVRGLAEIKRVLKPGGTLFLLSFGFAFIQGTFFNAQLVGSTQRQLYLPSTQRQQVSNITC